MDTFLVTAGYPALFLISFLAATVLPVGSEWLLVMQIAAGGSPIPLATVATVGNVLGACTTFWIGLKGGDWVTGRLLRVSEDHRRRAEELFRRYGSWSLLLSWLPVIGDPLCLAGGILRVPTYRFIVLVTVGKGARYASLAWLTMEGKRVLTGSLPPI